jgi:DNA-binding response OmpR family regulator
MNTIAVVDDDIHYVTLLNAFRTRLEVYKCVVGSFSAFLKQLFDYDLVIVDYSIPPKLIMRKTSKGI